MYIQFGYNIHDSREIMEKLALSTSDFIRDIKDISVSTGRDDTLAFKLWINPKWIAGREDYVFDPDDFDQLCLISQDKIKYFLEKLNLDYTMASCSSYTYDETTDSILSIAMVMYIESARKKLNTTISKAIYNNW